MAYEHIRKITEIEPEPSDTSRAIAHILGITPLGGKPKVVSSWKEMMLADRDPDEIAEDRRIEAIKRSKENMNREEGDEDVQ